jgi:DNA-binding NarL/FixJ family response regulator
MRREDTTEPVGPQLRVLVVDHRRAFSQALAERLRCESDVAVVAAAESIEEAEGVLDEVRPSVATVAIDLLDRGGLVLVTRARRSHPAVPWVVVGTGGSPLDLADALVAGASGYVTMDSSAAALAAALRGAVAGLSVVPDELLRRAIAELDVPGHRRGRGPWSGKTTAPGGLSDDSATTGASSPSRRCSFRWPRRWSGRKCRRTC